MMYGLSGHSESLYIKCLFRTISFEDVRYELRVRKLNPSEFSYHVMCLTLQLHLLQEVECSDGIVGKLKCELDGLKKKGIGFYCSIAGCEFTSKNYKHLMKHLKTLHITSNQRIVCQLHGCSREVTNVKMLDLHHKSNHNPRISSVGMRQNQLIDQVTVLKCMSTSCGHQTMKSLKELKIHIVHSHAEKKEEVECIFKGCSFYTRKSGTLTSHWSNKHKLQLVQDLKENIFDGDSRDNHLVEESCSVEINAPSENIELPVTNEVYEEDLSTVDDDSACAVNVESDELFIKSLAITFNTWSNVKNIAHSTVNDVVVEIFKSYKHGVEVTQKRVKKILLEGGIDAAYVEKLINDMDEDPFSYARTELEQESKRNSYLKKTFENVQPVTI